jgi:hypothetical protein
MYESYEVIYISPGATCGWFTKARSEHEAISKWVDVVQKGRSPWRVVKVNKR